LCRLPKGGGMEISVEMIEKKRTKWFALPICFTTYRIDEEKINIRRGLFNLVEDDAYMYKVQDVRLNMSMVERMFGLGTVSCYTGDTTDPVLKLIHVKHAREIKEFILKASEEARMKKRTVNMLDINGDMGDVER
jgi:uncharacterized membrane protein YdbT with pleckstrin-like domain